MTDSIIQTSFGTGEISSSLMARVDLKKYHDAAELLRNYFVDYRGGATSRPGTALVGKALYSTGNVRLIPFQFNNLQNYVLEFGDYYMRVVKDGGYVLETGKTTSIAGTVLTTVAHGYATGDTIYLSSGITGYATVLSADTYTLAEIYTNLAINGTGGGLVASRIYTLITPYAQADLPLLKYSQSADVMTLTHTTYRPRDLSRTGHAAWTLAIFDLASPIAPPATGLSGAATAVGMVNYGYVLTSVNAAGDESIASVRIDVINSVNMAATAGSITLAWNAVTNAVRYNIYRAQPSISAPIAEGALFAYIGSSYSNGFVDSNIVADFARTPPKHLDPFALNKITGLTISNGGGGYAGRPTIDVSDGTGTGQVIRPIMLGGSLASYSIDSPGYGFSAPTAVLNPQGGGGAGAVITVQFGPASGAYPGVSTYFQQRKVFAESYNSPQQFWMSKPGLYKNFDKSFPSRDDDALDGTLVANQVHDIRWMIPMQSGLIVLTGGGAWQISGGAANAAITPKTIAAQPQAYSGVSNYLQPIVVNFDILYVQSMGSIVRDLSYNFFANVYTGNDISVFASHLFFNYSIVSWAYAEEPFKIIWAVRNDGALLSLTFLKEQEIYAWARHDTVAGKYLQVCTVVEGDENAVYFVVERTINGTVRRYVERLATRKFSSAVDSWFVDSGINYTGTAKAVFSNLWHLEGQAVAILGDGNVFAQQTVAGGTVVLDHTVSTCLIGLPIQAQGTTVRPELGSGTIQGKRKKVSAVTVRVDKSRGLKIGRDFDNLVAVKERTTEAYGAPVRLTTGDERVIVAGGWERDGRVYWQQDDPLPSTVLGVIFEISVGDSDGR